MRKIFQEDVNSFSIDLLDCINNAFDNPIRNEDAEDLFFTIVDELFEKHFNNQGYRNYN